ncbi:MAG TPA: 2OG-Fe(II) oxygenase [Caulobacteraceae bacterium]|nr:2OG-Fe(II) oxygenase [Caulobacteraceae bacterium]
MTDLDALDWARIEAELDARGWALTGRVLTAAAASALAGGYDDDGLFRSRVVMARHGFGRGEYRYYAYPLPPPIQALREGLYEHLAPVANCWMQRLDDPRRFPCRLEDFTKRCRAAGQSRPTPLLLRYGPGDFNCLHQDLYGDEVFPLQAAFLLDQQGHDFDGGEFVIVEQIPRAQSRPQVVPLKKGEGVIFAVRERPAAGSRGVHRRILRHGVSELRAGRRHTLGVIFHDAA